MTCGNDLLSGAESISLLTVEFLCRAVEFRLNQAFLEKNAFFDIIKYKNPSISATERSGGIIMSFVVFADGSANLPASKLEGITLLPCSYFVEGVEQEYLGDVEGFDACAYYEKLKNGCKITTSLINTHRFLTHFRAVLEQGKDAVYIAMASGISGTYQAALLAKEELEEAYPDRFIHIVDSRGCGFGSGLLAIRAAELSRAETPVREAAALLDADVPHICQYFTVDDLNFLKRGGRVSGATAAIGTILNIKPILYGTADGHIVSYGRVRGRKKAIDALAEQYAKKQVDAKDRLVAISHGNCLEDAQLLAERIRAIAEPGELVIVPHEPFSGAHVGPGMLALFFYGAQR